MSIIIKGKSVLGPNVVTDGLVLYLDAGNTKSYPGSGTGWIDLSGRVNNGILANGPTFDSSNGGSIVFDGSNDYTDVADSSSINFGTNSFSFNFWIKSTQSSAYAGLIGKYGLTGGYDINMQVNGAINVEFRAGTGNITFSVNSNGVVNNGIWHQVSCCFNRSGNYTVYIDAVNICFNEVTDIGGGEIRLRFSDTAGNTTTFPNIGYATPINTPVCNGMAGGTYNYALGNLEYPETWTKIYTPPFTGESRNSAYPFRYGTKYIQFMILLNYNHGSEVQDCVWALDDIFFGECENGKDYTNKF